MKSWILVLGLMFLSAGSVQASVSYLLPAEASGPTLADLGGDEDEDDDDEDDEEDRA